MPQHSQRYWLAAFVVAWAVDFLFWGKAAGISFLIFTVLALAAGYWLLWSERARANWASHVLAGLVVILSAITVLRSEPFTRVLAGLFTFGGLGLLVMTFRSGSWKHFRMLDYIAAPFELMAVALARAARLRLLPAREGEKGRGELISKAAPVLRGLLLALPFVAILAALLAFADLVFADQLEGFLKSFNIDRLPEYLFRLFYILLLAYAFTGLYLQAILPTRWGMRAKEAAEHHAPAQSSTEQAGAAGAAEDAGSGVRAVENSPAEAGRLETSRMQGKQPFKIDQFLGSTEAFIVLACVNLLYAFFVAIQFRYLFGGQANITAAGYTFSEYARRGFFELVMVAVISLGLYLGLNAVTRREKPMQERAFTVLAVLLVGLVWVILASAFQRLLLYEDAYGFTSLRMYTHIFIPWLGLLLLATIVMQIARREQYFGALLLLAAFGFALSFGVLNIDGLIVRQNVARARTGAELDGHYLVGLSDDALPALVQEFSAPSQPEPIRETLGAVLSCRVYRMAEEESEPWQSYHPGKAAARQALVGLDLSEYKVTPDLRGSQMVYHKNLEFHCYPGSRLD